MDEDNHSNVYTGRSVMGIVLFSAFMASWFVWGPLGLICYVSGRFNSLFVFMLVPLFGLLLIGGTVSLPVVAIHAIVRWRALCIRAKLLECYLLLAMAALVTSFGLGFTGIEPTPINMFARGFAKYAARRADVPAIQTWLSTLNPKEYVGANIDSGGMPFPPAEQPPAIRKLNPERYPIGVRVGQDDSGNLMVRVTWGGGFIGHWGIKVGDKSVQPPADSEGIGYRPLAPGAWVWYENN
jgi:hypothetical protein